MRCDIECKDYYYITKYFFAYGQHERNPTDKNPGIKQLIVLQWVIKVIKKNKMINTAPNLGQLLP